MWNGDRRTARLAIEEAIEETGRADDLLAGWHNLWLGTCYESEGDPESAKLAYRRARQRLGGNLIVPTSTPLSRPTGDQVAGPFASSVDRIVGLTSADSYQRELWLLRERLSSLDGGTPRQMEESVRALGEVLGFEATRPDNACGTGPDVLWADHEACLAFELKTDKNDPAEYAKRDIAQGHDHLAWIRENAPDRRCLGLLFVGPDGKVRSEGTPAPGMGLTRPEKLAAVRDRLIALIEDHRRLLPIERPSCVRESCGRPEWTLAQLTGRLREKSLAAMRE